MAATSEKPVPPISNLPKYFAALSKMYPRQTGNATFNLFAPIYERIAPISSNSIIHDNASGPGTATSLLLSRLPKDTFPSIIATDMVPGMIDAFNSVFKTDDDRISGTVMLSQKLEFANDTFTHSITNFSIFNFAEPLQSVQEIYRTLKPGGQAVITTWKYFAIGEVVHETQRRIRPDVPLMKFSGAEWNSADAVTDLMVQAGFAEDSIQVYSPSVVVSGEDLEGLTEFACSPFTDSARVGWTEVEKGRWPEVAREVLKEKDGGLKFEGWALVATK